MNCSQFSQYQLIGKLCVSRFFIFSLNFDQDLTRVYAREILFQKYNKARKFFACRVIFAQISLANTSLRPVYLRDSRLHLYFSFSLDALVASSGVLDALARA